ncbi:sensor histidine kinase [Streptomyces sp. NPDC059906]|uniref:sensor histidine kinase n=1 Tax=Streptomyces sp. NPDC059906 TaxID=3346997 RepID=UPI003668731F
MSTTWQRYVCGRPRTLDVVVALALFGLSFPGSMLKAPDYSNYTGVLAPSAVLLAALGCIVLLWHREHPRAVVAATTGCTMAMEALGFQLTPLLMGSLMAALYSLAAHTGRETTRTYTIVATALLVVTSLVFGPGGWLSASHFVAVPWTLLPAVAGSLARLRRGYLAAVENRAEHAEQTRENEARRRVGEERMRIARELHDVVAHHITLANAQAVAAARLIHSRPQQAEELLGQLAGTTTSALRELGASIGVLRQSDDPQAPLEPTPGLDRLPDLIESLRQLGLEVSVTTEGAEQQLSPGVDLTAYRIIQGALTNVSKHAGTDEAAVRLVYLRDCLRITIADAGRGTARPAAESTGYGLIGMRERALSLGGRFFAGHRSKGGFEVATELPLHTREREPSQPGSPRGPISEENTT